MVARRIGDVYELQSHQGNRFFLQHVDTDKSQLSSQVVRVFAPVPATTELVVSDASGLETAFFTHVFLTAGETLKLWRKVGRAFTHPLPRLLWRTAPTEEMRAPVASSWEIWETNGRRSTVDPGSKVLHGVELGMVMSPILVVERAHTGKWTLVHPSL
jgi:hypothetical protein